MKIGFRPPASPGLRRFSSAHQQEAGRIIDGPSGGAGVGLLLVLATYDAGEMPLLTKYLYC